jgi:DNA-binding FadR family transcriptional regulator
MEKVSDHIINQIREKVASGELTPADKIGSEKELLAQLGVSKASLREALRVLEVMGIIEIRKGLSGGVYVADVDMKTTLTGIMNFIHFKSVSIKDITLMRYILEPMILRMVAPLLSGADVKNLQETMQRETSPAKAPGAAVRGIGFHRCLARITHNPILILVSDFIDNLLTDLKVQVNLDEAFYRRVRSFHQQTLDALQNRDVEQAIRLLIADILYVDEKIAGCLKTERFDPACLPETVAPAEAGRHPGTLADATFSHPEQGRSTAASGNSPSIQEEGKMLLREVGTGKLYLYIGEELTEGQENKLPAFP